MSVPCTRRCPLGAGHLSHLWDGPRTPYREPGGGSESRTGRHDPRFWISVILTMPLLLLAMSDMLPGQPVQHAFSARLLTWVQLLFATPVVLWGGWPFSCGRGCLSSTAA